MNFENCQLYLKFSVLLESGIQRSEVPPTQKKFKIYHLILKNLKLHQSAIPMCLLERGNENRRCHKKTSYGSNYAFSTLLHEWVDRGQMHRLEKLQ